MPSWRPTFDLGYHPPPHHYALITCSSNSLKVLGLCSIVFSVYSTRGACGRGVLEMGRRFTQARHSMEGRDLGEEVYSKVGVVGSEAIIGQLDKLCDGVVVSCGW